MIYLAIALTLLLAALIYLGRAGSRPLAERFGGLLYSHAIRAAALAKGYDSGVCRYRECLRDTLTSHSPRWEQQAAEWAREAKRCDA